MTTADGPPATGRGRRGNDSGRREQRQPRELDGPTSVLIGFLFVAACGYLAAVFLVREAARRDDQRLVRYFTRRAQLAGLAAGTLSLATLLELHSSRKTIFSGLAGRALPLVIIAATCGTAVLAMLTSGRPRGVRELASLGFAALVWGWGVAQYPTLLPGTSVTSATRAPRAPRW